MKRATFSTGLFRHQTDVVLWVRRRVVDSGGQWFHTGRRKIEQSGIIVADGVGLGKTWEALAASALILIEMSKKNPHGRRRRNVRRRPARILVLCPSGLISKWSREIRDPEGFSARLHEWASGHRKRRFVLQTLTEPYEIRRRTDLPAGKLARTGVTLPPGIYVCNWNVLRKSIGSGRSRLAALHGQLWDAVIVDEAHHREAREAIDSVLHRARREVPLLLLTATPFQLDPRELHDLFGTILDRSHGEHRVLAREPVRPFVNAMSDFFEGGEPPSHSEKRRAERVLRQAICRSHVSSGGRKYFVIDARGDPKPIRAPENLREAELKQLHSALVTPSRDFEAWYLRRRLGLADGDRTYIPNKLRQALHTPGQARASGAATPPESPRLKALAAWTRRQIARDLMETALDGYPRKVLVFTSFVGVAASELRKTLQESVEAAWQDIRDTPRWKRLADRAAQGALLVKRAIESKIRTDANLWISQDAQKLLDALREMSVMPRTHFVHCLFGHRRFRKLLVADLRRRLKALLKVISSSEEEGKWWTRLHREERRSLRATIAALGRSPIVATYTGHDDRRERDASGEAFRTPLAPWVLVASNVGSEGIDLHSFSAHLVHFDIEWNPARMEQREGRADRLVRMLKQPVNVYFILVRGTYDERMLHQLVTRQRWHSVLLGRPGARVARDNKGNIEARWLDADNVRRLTLDLRPARRFVNRQGYIL